MTTPANRRFTYRPVGAFSLESARSGLEQFPSGGRATRGKPADDAVMLAFLSDDWKPVAVRVHQTPQQVVAEVVDDRHHADVDQLRAQIARVLSLDIDGTPFDEIDDEVVASLREEHPGLRPVLFSSPYESALWAVLSQRTQRRQAAIIRRRLDERHGTVIEIDGAQFHTSIAPEQLLAVTTVQSMPASKLPWLHGIARAALDGALDADHLRSLDPAEASAEVKQIDGIGDFSADLILIRGAGAPDVFPRSEPLLHRAMTERYGLHSPTVRDLAEIAEGWSPRRSWASYLLRRTAGH